MNYYAKKHEEFKNLALLSYENSNNNSHNKWTEIGHSENLKNGYYAKIFKNDNEIVISIRGTNKNKTNDFMNDFQLLFNEMPSQTKDAFNTYKEIKKNFPRQKIYFTGHSLGGSLSIYMTKWTGEPSITFNAYGAKNMYLDNPHKEKTINYGNPNDPIFRINMKYLPGNTYITNSGNNSNSIITNNGKNIQPIQIAAHYLSEIGDLSTAVKYEPNVEKGTNILKGNISYEYYPDEIFDIKNRVLHRNEIDIETADKELIDLYADQLLDDYIPEKGELDMRVFAGDLIYVNNYQRQDGTKVSGYYRRRPAK